METRRLLLEGYDRRRDGLRDTRQRDPGDHAWVGRVEASAHQFAIVDILSGKQEALNTQKEKDVAVRTKALIKPSMIAALEDFEQASAGPQAAEPNATERRLQKTA